MLKLLSIVAIATAFSATSHAQQKDSQYFQIKSMNVEEQTVDQETLMKIRSEYKLQDLQQPLIIRDDENPLDPLAGANQIVDGIINLGAKIWKVFQASTPVVNLSSQRANALPKDVKDWQDMDSWSDVEAKQYAVSYKNGFNSNVVTFKVLMTYAYNGAFHGTGKYLNQVGFLINEYYVAPLYTLEGESEVVRVQNVGTHAAPVAGLEMNMVYRVQNVLNKSQSALNYYLRGDGGVKFHQASGH